MRAKRLLSAALSAILAFSPVLNALPAGGLGAFPAFAATESVGAEAATATDMSASKPVGGALKLKQTVLMRILPPGMSAHLPTLR